MTDETPTGAPRRLTRRALLAGGAAAVGAGGLGTLCRARQAADAAATVPWSRIGAVDMRGGLSAFWNVRGGDDEANRRSAREHGFQIVDIVNTYADYPGRQRESISAFLRGNRTNPWNKPPFFERIVRRNIAAKSGGAIFVNDIEFSFEEDADAAWEDPAARAASGVRTKAEFADAYYREWASWFYLPCKWARELHPGQPEGLYGAQPFRRDYYGIAGKTAQQIDGTHASDARLWQYIDPYVDFYVASVYVFYDRPDSVFYLAANVEENHQRTRRYGDRPLYAYFWLRYHDSNRLLRGQELAPYLVEAGAAVPYFCGARGVVLWGSEAAHKGQYYRNLPLYVASLRRVAGLSETIGRATPASDEPAHVAWRERRPLVRKLRVSESEWVLLAANPWQDEVSTSTLRAACGPRTYSLDVRGRHTEIYHAQGASVRRLPLPEPAT